MVSPHQRAVIVGGGVMGADIAAIFTAGGHAVDVVQRPGRTRDSLEVRVRKARAQLGSPATAVDEKARYEVALKRGLEILKAEDEND
jgi:3-hydroxyacyl-CoA dehydrogenase